MNVETWWEAYGGFVVLGLFAVLIPLFLWIGHRQWRRMKPEEWYRNVGISYLEDSVKPWDGLLDCIDTMWRVASDDYPRSAEKLMDFWIRVVPYGGTVRGKFSRDEPGKLLNGTVDVVRLYGLFKPTYILVVRQLRVGDLMIGSAERSALFHEAAEHLWPFLLGKSLTPDQKGHEEGTGDWHALTTRLEESHRARS